MDTNQEVSSQGGDGRTTAKRRVLGVALVLVVLGLMAYAMSLGLPRTPGIEREPNEEGPPPQSERRAP